jgi:hypothetical protein
VGFGVNSEIDELLVSTVDNWEDRFNQQVWLEYVMDEIMERVSYSTILNEPERYYNFVEGVRNGELVLDCLDREPKKRVWG